MEDELKDEPVPVTSEQTNMVSRWQSQRPSYSCIDGWNGSKEHEQEASRSEENYSIIENTAPLAGQLAIPKETSRNQQQSVNCGESDIIILNAKLENCRKSQKAKKTKKKLI